MAEQSSTAYHFGDLLALAREQWVRQMAEHVNRAGFDDYRRSDAALVRLLSRRPRSIGEIGSALGVTRQVARKFVTRLEQHGFVVTTRDAGDARQVNVELTQRGNQYAGAIMRAIGALDRRLGQRVDRAQLLAADTVLRASLPDEGTRARAKRLVPPP
jgi:DNA-binding MarR family transcriptional regulator